MPVEAQPPDSSRPPTNVDPRDGPLLPTSTRLAQALLIAGAVLGLIAAGFTWHALATAAPGDFGAGFVILATGPMFVISAALVVYGILLGWRGWFDQPADLPTILSGNDPTASQTDRPSSGLG